LGTIFIRGTLYITPPWKVIDVNKQNFDPMNFDFRDYIATNGIKFDFEYYERVCSVVKNVIKSGMSRELVEKILIEKGGAYLVLNSEGRRSYLNPVEIAGYMPLIVYSKDYQAQFFVVQYNGDNLVSGDIKCITERGPWAKRKYNSARERRKWNGTDIYSRK
jgi:hypothetical protein